MLNSADKISVTTSAKYSVPENRVVIDAGHGSQDSGAVSADGVLEKGINLAISHDTADLLRLFGYSVSMTRTDDNWLSDEGKNVKERKYNDMRARLELYNSSPENIVISIHQNKFSDSRSNGTQVFYSPNEGKSSLLAERIKYSVKELLQPENERECKAAGKDIYLLKNAEIPAVLVECGFISTRDEEQFMNSGSAADKYARGLFNAFLAYRKKHGGNITIPFKAEPAPQKVEIPQIVPQKKAQVKPSKEKLISYKNIPVIPSKKEPVQDDSINANLEVQSDVQPVSESEIQQKPAVQQPSEVEKQKPAAKQVSSPRQAQLPVFKVQFMTGSEKIKKGDRRFKGLANVDCFRDGSMYRYTVGSSSDYNQIYRLRKEILDKFPGSFIIAFKNGAMMNVNEAIKEFKANKRKNK
jgi:N-acetylmuramoyl-L-alanine amidase